LFAELCDCEVGRVSFRFYPNGAPHGKFWNFLRAALATVPVNSRILLGLLQAACNPIEFSRNGKMLKMKKPKAIVFTVQHILVFIFHLSDIKSISNLRIYVKLKFLMIV
jgi:hypothetical protein